MSSKCPSVQITNPTTLITICGDQIPVDITCITEAHSEPSKTSKMNLFEKLPNGRKALTIFAKSSILDV